MGKTAANGVGGEVKAQAGLERRGNAVIVGKQGTKGEC